VWVGYSPGDEVQISELVTRLLREPGSSEGAARP
jgi:hypothetical protein